jgi:P2-related tail formation protein
MVAASATIAAAKNVRSKLDRLRVAIGIPSEGPRHGLATTMGEVVTIAPRTNTTLAAGDRADAFGAATYGVETITLFPREAA